MPAVGLWQFSNGAEYYNHLLRHYATTEARQRKSQLGLGMSPASRLRYLSSKLDYSLQKAWSLTNRLAVMIVMFQRSGRGAFQSAIDQAVECWSLITLKQFEIGGRKLFYTVPLDGSRLLLLCCHRL
jgi:hypothetical protein